MQLERGTRQSQIALCVLLFCAALAGCADGSSQPELGGLAIHSALPGLPDDGMAVLRRPSVTGSIPGVSTFLDSGDPSAIAYAGNPAWLDLDGGVAGGFAWAIWQVPLAADVQLQELFFNIEESGFNRYWLAVADYSTGQWRFILTAQYPSGIQSEQTISLPAAGLPSEPALHSPAHNMYLACIVPATQRIKVAELLVTDSRSGGGNPGNDPIYDAFEDNDALDMSYLLGPGTHHASIHQTLRTDMSDPNEWTDRYDCYKVNVPAGKTLTATLRFEPFDHFWDGSGYRYENDLDLLFYMPGASQILNDFVEANSSLRIFYYQFEHLTFTSNSTQDYPLCVLGAVGEGVDSNAEYDLSIFLSDVAHTVSGYLKQQSALPTKKFVVFLEPGNFSDLTAFADDGELDGHFSITGVPDGAYTLKVASSFAFYSQPYTWPETVLVTVSGSDSAGNNIDIGADPPS